MDTNTEQKNTHINVFTGGMNTDTSDMVLNSSEYRYAENVRIIADKDQNSGELRVVEGTHPINTTATSNGIHGYVNALTWKKNKTSFLINMLQYYINFGYRTYLYTLISTKRVRIFINLKQINPLDRILYSTYNGVLNVIKLNSGTYISWDDLTSTFSGDIDTIAYTVSEFGDILFEDTSIDRLKKCRLILARYVDCGYKYLYINLEDIVKSAHWEYNGQKKELGIVLCSKQLSDPNLKYFSGPVYNDVARNCNYNSYVNEFGNVVTLNPVTKETIWDFQNTSIPTTFTDGANITYTKNVIPVGDLLLIRNVHNTMTINSQSWGGGIRGELRNVEDIGKLDYDDILCADTDVEWEDGNYHADGIGVLFGCEGTVTIECSPGNWLAMFGKYSENDVTRAWVRGAAWSTPVQRVNTFYIQKGGSFVIHPGSSVIYNIKFTPTLEKAESIEGEVLYTGSINNLGVIMIKKDTTWSVYTFDGDTYLTSSEVNLIAGPFTEPLWSSDDLDQNGKLINNPVSVVLRWEAEGNVKMYIADGIHTIKVLQLAKGFVGDDYTQVFEHSTYTIESPNVRISGLSGNMPGPVVLYAYRTYSDDGAPSSLSPLSEKLFIYKDEVRGYSQDEKPAASVEILLNERKDNTSRIQIFRLTHKPVGLIPQIHMVYDGNYITRYIDNGTNIEEIDAETFLSYDYLKVIPKYIESKGNYLYGANTKYITDEINQRIKNFDVRCFSSGNYFIQNSLKISCLGGNYDTINGSIGLNTQLYHNDFESSYIDYDEDNWKTNVPVPGENTRYNGIGLYFNWRYTYKSQEKNTYDVPSAKEEDNVTVQTYRRGDVYRFGVIFFDEYGNKSSVKWIADIRMPSFNASSPENNIKPAIESVVFPAKGSASEQDAYTSYIQNNIGIEFIPTGIDNANGLWLNVSGYQIVQCERTIADKYTIFQGITGYTLTCQYPGKIQHPAFLTLCGLANVAIAGNNSGGLVGAGYLVLRPGTVEHPEVTYTSEIIGLSTRGSVLFACPELCYNKDDAESVISTIDSNSAFLDNVCEYGAAVGASIKHYTFPGKEVKSGGDEWNIQRGVWANGENKKCFYIDNPRKQVTIGGLAVVTNLNLGIEQTGSAEDTHYALDSGIMDLNIYRSLYAVNTDATGLAGETQYTVHDGKAYRLNFPSDSMYNRKFDGSLTPGNGSICRASRQAVVEIGSIEKSNDDFGKINIRSIQRTNMDGEYHFGHNGEISSLFRTGVLTPLTNVTYVNWYAPGHYMNYGDSVRDLVGEEGENYNMGRLVSGTAKRDWNNNSPIPQLTCASNLARFTALGNLSMAYRSNWFIGRGGHAFLMQTDDYSTLKFATKPQNGLPPIFICNLINRVAIPYGGYTKSAIESSTFVLTPAISKGASNVKCFAGDCFINNFNYTSLYWHGQESTSDDSMAYMPWHTLQVVYMAPIESELNLRGLLSDYNGPNANFGYDFRRNNISGTYYGYTQKTDQYMYDNTYSATGLIFSSYTDDTKGKSQVYDTRIHYSHNKLNGEDIDNWTLFDAADHIDVDTRYGEITGLKLYKDKILFFQKHAMGILSSQERTLINDAESAQISLGTGGLTQRFDYVTVLYGMKPEQGVVTTTDNATYWWDGYQKEIIRYTDGFLVTPLSQSKNIKTLLENREEVTRPAVLYDRKYKEVLFNVVRVENPDDVGDTIVFNEYVDRFTSVYKFSPYGYCDMNGYGIIVKNEIENNTLYKYNTGVYGLNGYISTLFGVDAKPLVRFVVNNGSTQQKVFDNQHFNGVFYPSIEEEGPSRQSEGLRELCFSYDTPLNQHAEANGINLIVSNIENDYKLAIPRNNNSAFGDRLRGKTMQCEIKSDISNLDFSLQYVITKFRISCT